MSIGDLQRIPHDTPVRLGGLVVARQRPGTAKGIVFLLLEDEFGTINLIVPPDLYEANRLTVRSEPLLLCQGRLEKLPQAGGGINIFVKAVRALVDAGRREGRRRGTGRAARAGGRDRAAARARRAAARRPRPWRVPPGLAADPELRVGAAAIGAAPAVSFGLWRSDGERSEADGAASHPPERVHCTPVGTLFFVLAFVALGLATLVIAMSRGRGGLGGMMHSQTRGSRRFATFLFFVSCSCSGSLVPAWVISRSANNDDIPYAQVSGLTEDEKHGQELFGQRCSLCHTLKAANAVARVGPDLDALAPNEEFTLDAIVKGRSNGNGRCPPSCTRAKTPRTLRNLSQSPWAPSSVRRLM